MVKIIKDDALKTWDLGIYPGTPQTDETQGAIDTFLINSPDKKIEGGESFTEFSTRVLGLLRKLVESAPANTVVVTHNSVFGLIKLWDKKGRPKNIDKPFRIEYTKQGSDTGAHFEIKGKEGPIYICRHGETEDNVKKVFRTDEAQLTDKGVEEAEELADTLKDVKISEIICSPLDRTVETSRIIADMQNGEEGEPVKDKEKKVEDEQSEDSPADFMSYIWNCQVVAKMFQLTTDRYVVHKQMGKFICESEELYYCIGKQLVVEYGPLKDFEDYGLEEYEGYEPLQYFKEAKEYIQGQLDSTFKDASHAVRSEIEKLVKLINNVIFHISMMKS